MLGLHNTSCLNVKHLLTFDIEHWYEGYRYRGVGGWERVLGRDDRIVNELLDILAQTSQRATLFITGQYAQDFPCVVRRAQLEGHEIASHSFTHNVLSRMGSVAAFREDLIRSVSLLEDLTGEKVKGYRAPKWSIFDFNYMEMLGVMHEVGLLYDSSVFPGLFDEKNLRTPHRIELEGGGMIWEFPATTHRLMCFNLPAAGGAYFRLFPLWFTRATLKYCRKVCRPGMIYMHPYDLDPCCPRLRGGGFLFQLARNWNVGHCKDRLLALLRQFEFSTISQWLVEYQKMKTPS